MRRDGAWPLEDKNGIMHMLMRRARRCGLPKDDGAKTSTPIRCFAARSRIACRKSAKPQQM